jgi:predicted tellurium resistance membrane protein TerC
LRALAPLVVGAGRRYIPDRVATSKDEDTMLELLADPNAWASLLTLTALEIVLGIDNIIFLSIVSSKLPVHQQQLARRIGLGLALLMRVALLASIAWIIGLTQPAFSVWGHEVTWRDLVLGGGGLFLLVKGTMEIHHMAEGHEEGSRVGTTTFVSAIIQIVLLDIVFSLDSVITAVGMADDLPIMIAAVVIAIIVMLVASEPVSHFVNEHPTVKMLALSFLLLVGMALVADGLHYHIPRGYLYFAIAFSAGVEALNLLAASARKRRRQEQERAEAAGVGLSAPARDRVATPMVGPAAR